MGVIDDEHEKSVLERSADALDVGCYAWRCGERHRKLMSTAHLSRARFRARSQSASGVRAWESTCRQQTARSAALTVFTVNAVSMTRRRPKLKMPSREAVREALEARLIVMSEADDLPEAITYSVD